MMENLTDMYGLPGKLSDCLMIHTKDNLKYIAELLRFPIPAKLRKNEYAVRLAEAVLGSPETWLPRLTHYELTLLDKLVKAGVNDCVEGTRSLKENTLEFFSFIEDVQWDENDPKARYIICNELREAIAPCLNEYLTSEKQAVRFMIEQYAYGATNLYGLLHLWDLAVILKDCLPDWVTEEDVADGLANSILLEQLSFVVHEDNDPSFYLASALLTDTDRLEEEWRMRADITDRKKFSKEEIFGAGMLPVAIVPNPDSDELKEYLMGRLGYASEAADCEMMAMWFISQLNDNPMSIINSVISGKLNSLQELQEAIELFSGYLNSCPRWTLKGYSPDEAYTLFEKGKRTKNAPRLVVGSGMKAAGRDITPDMQAMADGLWAGHKVGRNDPCPCGSGKKFKKCCGMEN